MYKLLKAYIFFLIIFIFFILFNYNCKPKHDRIIPAFIPSLNENQLLDTLITADLNNDGINEYLLLTKERDLDSFLNFYRFDQFQVFSWNPKNEKFDCIFIDTVYYGTSLSIINGVNNIFSKLIQVNTFSGGNDTILSTGMQLYGCNDKTISKIFYKDVGKPIFFNIDSDSLNEILISNSVFFKATDHKPINYYIGIYKFINNSYIDCTLNFKDFFYKEININKNEYYKNKKTKTINNSIIDNFLKVCLYYQVINDFEDSRLFYYSEKDYLLKLGEDSFLDITRILFENGLELSKEIDSISISLFNISNNYYKEKQFKNAKNMLLKILDIAPNFLDAYFLLADIALINKEYDDAISYYQQAAIFTTEDKRLFYGLGRCYEGKKDYKTAKEFYQKYIAIDSLSEKAIEIKSKLLKKEYN